MTDTEYWNRNEATVIGMEWEILTCISEPILVHVMFGVGGPMATVSLQNVTTFHQMRK